MINKMDNQNELANKKIIFLATEYQGGMRPYALSIIKNIWNKNCKIIIVCRFKQMKDDFKDFPQENLIFIDYPKGKFNRIKFRLCPTPLKKVLNQIIKTEKPDLLYTLNCELILASFINRLKQKVKIIHTVHDAISHDKKVNSIFQWINDRFFLEYPNNKVIRSAPMLVTNSELQYEYLRNKYPNKPHFKFNFPGLVTQEIKKGNMVVPELVGISNYILFFGNIQLYKGVHLLYETYVNHPDLHLMPLVIAGTAPLYFPVETLKSGNVILINRFIEDEELYDLFSNAAVSVYPYISATQSGVLSISSYFGTKILLSDIPYFKSIVNGDKGIRLVNVKDSDKFHDALTDLIKSDENTYEYYSENYDDATWGKGIRDILNGILEIDKD